MQSQGATVQATPPPVLATLVTSLSLNAALGVGVYAAAVGDQPFYEASLVGGAAGGGCAGTMLAFWGVAAAVRAVRRQDPPTTG
jgi:hypothetical protein